VSMIFPEDLTKTTDQKLRTVPLMRTCIQCNLRLPSTMFWSWMIERYSKEKLVRDGMCKNCREIEGTPKEKIYDRMVSFLERGGGNDDIREIVIM
jgi:hypothetical protein